MNISYGNKDIALIECINPKIGKYRIRFNVKQHEEDMVSFYEFDVLGKPTFDSLAEEIERHINSETDRRILSEFVWRDIPIWLSMENQFNYKAAYDLAMQTGGGTLPVTFKLGDSKNPIYHEFTTVEELSDFYIRAINFVSETLKDGWLLKDEIELSKYQDILSEL